MLCIKVHMYVVGCALKSWLNIIMNASKAIKLRDFD